jgi:transcriptional antiterminator NusG
MLSRYYVIQVRSRGELKYLNLAEEITQDLKGTKIFWPRRSLRIKRHGSWKNVISPIFPGYVFLETDEVGSELYWALRRLPGFYRFLKSNRDICPMPEADARVLTRLLSMGEIVERSKADFDENNRIRILEGPLRGLEGQIIKVDRRKGRAKVRLDLYDESYTVDFGFQAIEKQSKRETK